MQRALQGGQDFLQMQRHFRLEGQFSSGSLARAAIGPTSLADAIGCDRFPSHARAVEQAYALGLPPRTELRASFFCRRDGIACACPLFGFPGWRLVLRRHIEATAAPGCDCFHREQSPHVNPSCAELVCSRHPDGNCECPAVIPDVPSVPYPPAHRLWQTGYDDDSSTFIFTGLMRH